MLGSKPAAGACTLLLVVSIVLGGSGTSWADRGGASGTESAVIAQLRADGYLPVLMRSRDAGVAASVAAAPTLAWDYPYRFQNVHSGKCLTVRHVSEADNASVIQYDCDWAEPFNEVWYFSWAANGANGQMVYIKNGHSMKCLTIFGASPNDGAPAVQYTCDTSIPYNERWYIFYREWAPGNYDYRFVNVNSGKALTIHNASLANEAAALQWTDNVSPHNERWKIMI